MKKNIVSLVLATAVASATVVGMAGCGGETNNKPDANKVTYVKLLHYDAGYGRAYLEKTARAFEKEVENISYEDGKKGVYIDIEHSQMDSTGQNLLNSLSGSPYDMFLTTGVTPADMKNNGNVLEISSLLNATKSDETPLSPFADETSIYQRMYPDMQEYYSNTDNTMYGIPVFMISYHLYYDAELVANRGLYIDNTSTDAKIKLTNNLAKAQKGVDGKSGTSDDGLPETWAQFYLWLTELENKNITPIHYSELYQQHMDYAMQQFWADFEGKDATKACWTFDGTKMTDLIDAIDDDGNVTYLPETEITLDNGYMVQKQEGRYRVMQLNKKLADSMKGSDKLISNYAFSGSENHTEAQGTYISSKYTTKPIMLFAEGSYWEAEATDKFESYESRNGGKMDRKFAVLPTPKYSREDVGENSRTTVLVDSGLTMMLHKKLENATNKQAAIDFMMYFNMEDNMDMQHNAAASMRPFTYEIDDEVSANMSYLLKDYHNLMSSERTDLVFGTANNDFVRANSTQLNKTNWIFYSQYRERSDEKSYLSIKTFKDNSSAENLVTAEDYFEGFYRVYTYKTNANAKTLWDTMLDKIR